MYITTIKTDKSLFILIMGWLVNLSLDHLLWHILAPLYESFEPSYAIVDATSQWKSLSILNRFAQKFLVWCNLFFSTGKNKLWPVHNYLSSVQYVWVCWLTDGHIQDPQMYTFHDYQPQVVWCFLLSRGNLHHKHSARWVELYWQWRG